jgi:hypothetical protein
VCVSRRYSGFTLGNSLRNALPKIDTPDGPHSSHSAMKLLGLCTDLVFRYRVKKNFDESCMADILYEWSPNPWP